VYKNLKACVEDLEKKGELLKIEFEVDPRLEMAEIHRRINHAGGPAILFTNVKGSPFPALSNLYGTWERTEYLFKNEIKTVQQLGAIKTQPERLLKHPFRSLGLLRKAIYALPWKRRRLPSHFKKTRIDQLPAIISWPDDGGAFVTLPQVLTLGPDDTSITKSNIGMYRIQLDGNEYQINEEIGLHYQLHRGIGVHHKAYNQSEKAFKVSIFIGGPPAHSVAAIMPLPEGLSETAFAGLLASRRFRYTTHDGYVISTDADFVICGEVDKENLKPEGPFGDHLGYYSLAHPFPYMKVKHVFHRKDAIWQFTVVGRPPAEDSNFGKLIHDIVGDITPSEFPGLVELNAVDAAGVHPLLLAIGKERYMPFRERRPEELLTIANHLLGKGQTSLAKYLIISDKEDNPELNTHDIPAFLAYVLERFRPEHDLHFYTNWTIDTLDYSGHGWNAGSKLVVAAAGEPVRKLSTELGANIHWPASVKDARMVLPGIIACQMQAYSNDMQARSEIGLLGEHLQEQEMEGWPLIILCDDAQFLSETLNNFLWATFTRSNPAADLYGVRSFCNNKHWGCHGSVIIDARLKPHHAPPLITDPEVTKLVDSYFAKGGPLHGII
jgi:4-hydroxy-3-polyprenylbenzoate decarboxylase